MRRVAITLAIVAAVLAAALLYLRGFAGSPTPLFVISHDIEIAASADEVWGVLTDFAAYPDWNPYALKLEGELEPGSILTLTITQGDWPDTLTVYPKLVKAEPHRELWWHGDLFIPGLHETDHYFRLRSLGPQRTRLHHAEEFRGWLARLLDDDVSREHTRTAFQAMNEALAARVESGAAAGR